MRSDYWIAAAITLFLTGLLRPDAQASALVAVASLLVAAVLRWTGR